MFVENYSKQLTQELNNQKDAMEIQLNRYNGFIEYTFDACLRAEGYRITTKYKTDLGEFEYRYTIKNKEGWNSAIDTEDYTKIHTFIKPIICKASCSSYLKRYNSLLLDKVVNLYKEADKHKEGLEVLYELFKESIEDRKYGNTVNESTYSNADKWQINIYDKLQKICQCA